MSVSIQEEKVYKAALKRKLPLGDIAVRAGFDCAQQITTAAHNLVRAGKFVRHADKKYSKV